MSKLTLFLIRLIIVSLVLFIIGLILNMTSLSQYYLPIFPWLILIYALITGLEYYYVSKPDKSPAYFTRMFMAASAIKLLILLAVTVIYLIINRENVIQFVVVLFVLYIVYTVFGVRSMLKANR